MYSLHHCNIYVNSIIWLMFNGKDNSEQTKILILASNVTFYSAQKYLSNEATKALGKLNLHLHHSL